MSLKRTVLILAAFAAGPVYADCSAPGDTVTIPNGATATRDEMVAASRAVKALDAAVKSYGDCLKQEEDAKVTAGADAAKTHNAYAKLNNVQVNKMHQVADKFNEELHAFKAKNP